MCGLVGFSGEQNNVALKKMMNSIYHRGPDDEANFSNKNFSVGFRRLAIIDLTKSIYPLENEDGKVKVFLNGEIYNYKEIKNDLIKKGHTFKTNSDTEVIAHGYEEWGEDVVYRLRGMFVFVLFDLGKNILFIARDRLGIKPLYYAEKDGRIIFSSEIKGILSGFDVNREPDETSVYNFLTSRVHDINKNTFFNNIKRLLPGHIMVIDSSSNYRIEKYWNPSYNVNFASARKDKEYSEEFKSIFSEAINLHLISDVPVGVTLSGGLDSSGIAALANKEYKLSHKNNKFYSFSAVHPNETINEEEYIDNMINATEVTPIKVIPSVDKFWNEVDLWTYFQEEPVISGAPYAYYTVMREARKYVTVLLTGQGGDELLAGYIPYFMTYFQSALDQGKVFKGLKEIFSGRDLYSKYILDKLESYLSKILMIKENKINPHEMINKNNNDISKISTSRNLNERLFNDVTSLTTPSFLRYEDKNSMANSLESRVPLLDHVLVEYIFNLPIDQKIKFGWNRFVYREAMKGIIPDKNRLRRSKIGFTNPEWEWIERKKENFISIFSSDLFKSRKFWNAEKVLNNFIFALEGKLKGDILFFWRVFSVEMWLRTYVDEFNVRNTSIGIPRTVNN